MNTVTQGTIGLGVAIAYFCKKGFAVSVPLNDNQPYDLIVDDGKLNRVQVKTTRQKKNSGNYSVMLKSVRTNKTENKIKNFDKTDSEILFVYVVETGDSYVIPTKEIDIKCELTLDGRFEKYRVD